MKRALVLTAILGLLGWTLATGAAAKEKLTVAYLDEDSHRAVFYAL